MRLLKYVIMLLFVSGFSFTQSLNQDFRFEDKIRIKEAINFFNGYGHKLWNDWDKSTFGILLVTSNNEYLINHPNPGEEFKLVGFDSVLSTDIYTRGRKFPTNFLATFNAVSNIPTVVVGQPENAGRSSLGWLKALLHEHFHQYQYSQADYVEKTKVLDLAGDDSTGMWMLNYPFPYEEDKVAGQYRTLTLAAKNTAFAERGKDFENNYNLYRKEREKFKNLLSEKDYRYFSFQIWQEGIAQYTENQMIQIMKDAKYQPSDEFRSLTDYKDIDSFYVRVINNLMENAELLDLRTSKRACFYTLGALEGMILDKVNPKWNDLYLKDKLSIDSYFK
ncbi:MAG: hypothetical protein L0Y79_11300 [Chlorobi bacterium]|nr:hypothetical protein [Chlorobiota bacterium]MCI0715316.1 hypothetical protein [Chlorobiota bacterium]